MSSLSEGGLRGSWELRAYDRRLREGWMMIDDPHADGELVWRGDVERARGVVVMLHGRGASAEDILGVWEELDVEGLSAVAPRAMGGTWYPRSFLAPVELNQPWLNSALNKVESVVRELMGRGIASERIALLGFSQGACLACEFVLRHPRKYGAVMGLTGGLIGSDVKELPAGASAPLAGTPVFLGSGDPDMHVPFERVRKTADILKRMGASVDLRRYPGMGHTINEEEIDACGKLLEAL